MVRCRWADPNSEIYLAYHDREWGRPEHDDRKLFEMLTLEGFQAGLSWLTILKKRKAFRTAFDSFEPAVVAGYGPEKVEVLMADAGIVRNRAKIQATSTDLSDKISKDLKRRGMKFVGTTIIYSFLQAVGVVNDHELACFCHPSHAE